MDLNMTSASIPQSALRSSAQQQISNAVHDQGQHSQDPFQSVGPLQYSPFAAQHHQQELQHPNGHFSADSNDFSASNFQSNDFHADFFPSTHHGEDFHGLHFGNMGENHNFGHDFEPFPPCDDCSTTNPATIPHHHHKTGRLAGAAPQLDGHYCCRWLIHDQPCLSCFSSAEDLDNHIKTDHAGKDGTYRCLWQDCQKIDKATNTIQPVNFGNKPKLMRHVHSHTGFKPFPCPYPGCDKGFVTKEQLRNHETTHTKSRKYTCEQCGKAFAVKSALTTHITAVHEERKIHKCDMCGKAFADSSNLSKHKQTHWKSGNGVMKRRSTTATATATAKREISDGNSTRTSPSIPTPTQMPATPVVGVSGADGGEQQQQQQFDSQGRELCMPFMSPSESMLPPLGTHSHQGGAFMSQHTAHAANSAFYNNGSSSQATRANSTISTTSSSYFDPSCYCCEQNCPQPDYCCDQNCPPPPPDFDEGHPLSSSSSTSSASSSAGPSTALASNWGLVTEYCCDATECAPTTHPSTITIHQTSNDGLTTAAMTTTEYCCEEEACAPPAGEATICTARPERGESCDRATFCDLPGCLDGGPAAAVVGHSTMLVGGKGLKDSTCPGADAAGEVFLDAEDVEALKHFSMPGPEAHRAGATAGAGGGGSDGD